MYGSRRNEVATITIRYSKFYSFLLFLDRRIPIQATAGLRRCRRNDELSYRARIDRLPQLSRSLPEARQLEQIRAVENCGPPGALVEESKASRIPLRPHWSGDS